MVSQATRPVYPNHLPARAAPNYCAQLLRTICFALPNVALKRIGLNFARSNSIALTAFFLRARFPLSHPTKGIF